MGPNRRFWPSSRGTPSSTFDDQDESAFVRVHDADDIRAAKRLYMTAKALQWSEPGPFHMTSRRTWQVLRGAVGARIGA